MAAILKGLSINKGLVGYWPLGNLGTVKGNVAVDLSGRGNPGTLIGSPPLVPGNIGRALSLDGASQHVTVADAAAFSISAGATYSAWINTSMTSGLVRIIEKQAFSLEDKELVLYWTGTKLTVCAYLHNIMPASDFLYGTVDVTRNVWHLIAFTYNGASVKVYVDGALDVTTSVSGSVMNSTAGLAIGARPDGTAPFAGSVREARIYNRALSPAEVWQLYTNRNPNFGLIPSRRLGLNAAAGGPPFQLFRGFP